MTFVSYAQNFEDVLLWRVFHDVERGHYVDVGAHDPAVDSVSLAFYKAGWLGVHVEPIPFYAARLRDARPEESVIEAAVTDAGGPIVFYELSGLSSGLSSVADYHRNAGHNPTKILVPTVRLENVFKLISDDIHWLKIDVEGMEGDALRSWGASQARPWVLVIESTFPTTQEPTHELWIDDILQRGYREVYFDGLSRYFLHESQEDRRRFFESPPNVFDGFTVTQHHFSAAAIRIELEAAEQRIRDEQVRSIELAAHLKTEQASSADSQNRLVDALQAKREAEGQLAEVYGTIALAESEHRQAIENLRQERRESEQSLRSAQEKELIEARWAERRDAERELRCEFRKAEDQLRQALAEAEGHSSSICAQLARFQERAEQLQERLTLSVRERDDARAEAVQARAAADRGRDEAEQTRWKAEQTQVALDQKLGIERAQFESTRNELERQLSELREQLASIYASRIVKLAGWLRILKAPPTRRPTVAINHQQSDDGILADPRYGMESTLNDVLHVNNLLMLNGTAFVDTLYRTFLKRAPDRPGRDHFIQQLREGHGKEAVLLAIATSREAQAVGASVEGVAELQRAQVVRKGWFVRGDRALQKRLNRLEFNIGEAHDRFIDRLDLIQKSIDQVQAGISGGGLSRGGERSGTANRAVQSIKSGISIATPVSASEFVDSLKEQVQSSSEALLLRRN